MLMRTTNRLVSPTVQDNSNPNAIINWVSEEQAIVDFRGANFLLTKSGVNWKLYHRGTNQCFHIAKNWPELIDWLEENF